MSILLTNRQVYLEASNVFYMDNMFVRFNLNKETTVFETFELGDPRPPYLYWGRKDHVCKRHVMEIDVIRDHRRHGRSTKRHFMLASDDLPKICRILLMMDGMYVGSGPGAIKLFLRETELWITIGDEVGTTARTLSLLNMCPDDRKGEFLDAAIKNAAAHLVSATIREKGNGFLSPNADRIINAKSWLPESPSSIDNARIRKLLEPLRALHSIEFSYIDAPISERYWHEIQRSLSRARPSFQERFQVPVAEFEAAITTFSAENFDLAIQKLRGTLDTLLDFEKWSGELEGKSIVATGPFAGLSLSTAIDQMRYITWNHLARANLEFHSSSRHVRTAQAWVQRIMGTDIYKGGWADMHELAMLFYLKAEVWEALDQLGEHTRRPRSEFLIEEVIQFLRGTRSHPRFETLAEVIYILRDALHYEPGNAMLKRELERREEEWRMAKEEEATRMFVMVYKVSFIFLSTGLAMVDHLVTAAPEVLYNAKNVGIILTLGGILDFILLCLAVCFFDFGSNRREGLPGLYSQCMDAYLQIYSVSLLVL